jgi:hydrogenase maturation protease
MPGVMKRAPCLVIAVGNPSRGDDALAPALLQRLREWVTQRGQHERIELLEDFQLQVEHAADLQERECVLFLDAGMNTPSPYTLDRIHPHGGRALLSHSLPPEDVLATYVQVFQRQPPPSFLLCISGAAFELGASLSRHAAQNLESAYAITVQLMQAADVAAWEALLAGPILPGG